MTEPRKDKPEPDDFAAEEYVEDLEAPASEQEDVAGGLPPQCHITSCSIEGETTIVV